jgi:uncharacterized repeat protein (TIGR02543 family)
MKLLTGYAGYNPQNSPMDYKLFLPEGEYEITTGHLSFWNGQPRPMDLYFNDELVEEGFDCGERGDYLVLSHEYMQAADGELTIRVNNTANEGAALSFIFVNYVEDIKPVMYTVTFDEDNGAPVYGVSVIEGEKVAKPADPARDGYVFAGWYLGAAPFDFNTAITGDITLTARWNIQSGAVEMTGAVLYHESKIPATVKLYDGSDDLVYTAVTTVEGNYTLSAIEGSGYTLVVTKPGYLKYTIKNFAIINGEDIDDIDFMTLGGDVNNDGWVDAEDIGLLINCYNKPSPAYPYVDIDGDGFVDSVDIAILMAGFGNGNVIIIK